MPSGSNHTKQFTFMIDDQRKTFWAHSANEAKVIATGWATKHYNKRVKITAVP